MHTCSLLKFGKALPPSANPEQSMRLAVESSINFIKLRMEGDGDEEYFSNGNVPAEACGLVFGEKAFELIQQVIDSKSSYFSYSHIRSVAGIP